MVRTSQRSVPIALFILAVALLGARIIVQTTTKRDPAKDDLVRWTSLREGVQRAAQTGKPILLDFTADWCQPCHMLDEEVFRNPAIAREINERFIAIRVVDRKREEGRNPPDVAGLQQRFRVRGFPTVIFAVGGGERGRMEGFRGADEFERVMESVR